MTGDGCGKLRVRRSRGTGGEDVAGINLYDWNVTLIVAISSGQCLLRYN